MSSYEQDIMQLNKNLNKRFAAMGCSSAEILEMAAQIQTTEKGLNWIAQHKLEADTMKKKIRECEMNMAVLNQSLLEKEKENEVLTKTLLEKENEILMNVDEINDLDKQLKESIDWRKPHKLNYAAMEKRLHLLLRELGRVD
tara:strand:- start:1267 stop:1692 length:426 start_codon:yes stop_codon:yes gene_type:complete